MRRPSGSLPAAAPLPAQGTAITTAQQPIGSGFGAHSTAAEVLAGLDLTGRLAVVTGGSSGLGQETTRALRGAGATVVVAVRRLGGPPGATAR
ncbi:hypothetical protein FB563_7084 [Streptomyces puniciscabiei]|uniref:Short subunit dehydrogenase n=1 Tax=Streptomyces puniciscabiei TaxID=164348 RepID=A0A542TJE4_9ACTN|nr:hypothetical protein FB563_7084 [Streptomyces puniciscabiei]